MALIDCPECNSKISDKALACPQCGYPIEHKESTLDELYQKPILASDLNVSKGFQNVLVSGENFISGFFISEINPDLNILDCRCAVESREKGLVITIGSKDIDIHFTQIVEISVEHKKTIIEQNKSVLGRAAIGGAVLGGVGAIVGALSGQNKKAQVLSGALILTFFEPKLGKIIQFIMLVNFEKYDKKLKNIKTIIDKEINGIDQEIKGIEPMDRSFEYKFYGNESSIKKVNSGERSSWDAPITSSGNFKTNIVIWTLLGIVILFLLLSFD
tara:strand:+ start:2286 stop:3101 length:816 start_codon:yes stop_codon:yes gene_type:complete